MSRICVSVVVAVWIAVFTASAIAAEPGASVSFRSGAKDPAGASKASPKPTAAAEPAVPRYANPYSPYPPQPRPDVGKQVRVVYRLKNVPATDAAKAITEFLGSEMQPRGPQRMAFPGASAPSVKIVAEPVSNSLLIAGRSEMVDEVRKIAGELDVPQPAVAIEVVIGEAPAGKVKPAESPKPDRAVASSGAGSLRVMTEPPPMETIARVRLMTLDNQAAYIQLGQRIPLFGSVYTAATGGKEKQPGLTNVGLILGVTPRVSPDGPIFMEVDVEKSQLGPEQEGVPIAVAGNQVVRSPRIETTLVQTTVRVSDGQTIVLGSIAARGKQDKELFLVLTPHVLDGEKAKKPR